MGLANQTGLSNKVVSERHHYASQVKMTAGEAAKQLSKTLGVKISAKEIVEMYKILHGRDPEWHHSGFYKANGKKSTMGRTFFFDESQVSDLADKQEEIKAKKLQKEEAERIKRETIVQGFYFYWSHDYSGYRGKKRNYKVLGTYSGSEAEKPSNFTATSPEVFEKAKASEGRKYYGWDEPLQSEFI